MVLRANTRLVSFRYTEEELRELDQVVREMQISNQQSWILREVNRTTVLKRLVVEELRRIDEQHREIQQKLEQAKLEAAELLRKMDEESAANQAAESANGVHDVTEKRKPKKRKPKKVS